MKWANITVPTPIFKNGDGNVGVEHIEYLEGIITPASYPWFKESKHGYTLFDWSQPTPPLKNNVENWDAQKGYTIYLSSELHTVILTVFMTVVYRKLVLTLVINCFEFNWKFDMGGINNGQILNITQCPITHSGNSSIYDLLVKYLFDVRREYVIEQGNKYRYEY